MYGRTCAVCQRCSQLLTVQKRLLATASKQSPSLVTADLEDQTHRKPKHFYTSGYVPWNTQDQLVKHLHSQIIFNNDDYIALNKPPGIPMTVNKERPHLIHQSFSMKNMHMPEFATFSMNDAMDELSIKLNLKRQARLGLPCHRLNSGIVIYTKNKQAGEKLQTWWRNTRANKIFALKYWALVLGIPNPKQVTSGDDIFYVQRNKDEHSIMKYESIKFATRDKRQNGKAVQSNMKHRVLASHPGLNVSLVEVQPTWSVNDMLPLYLAHRLSPILGDHIYSHIVTQVSGVPMIMASSIREETRQKLQPEILRALGFKKADNIFIPLHLHLAQAVVPVIGKKGKFCTINAPMPEMFVESLKRFGMEHPEINQKIKRDELKPHNYHVDPSKTEKPDT